MLSFAEQMAKQSARGPKTMFPENGKSLMCMAMMVLYVLCKWAMVMRDEKQNILPPMMLTCFKS
jgi:hypothetical protein